MRVHMERGHNGQTPLSVACHQGRTEVATIMLLGAGAAVDTAASEGEKRNAAAPALLTACYQGHTEVITGLLGAGAVVDTYGGRRWRHAAAHGLPTWPHRGRHRARVTVLPRGRVKRPTQGCKIPRTRLFSIL